MRESAFKEYYNTKQIKRIADYNADISSGQRRGNLAFHYIFIDMERRCNLSCRGCFVHLDRNKSYQKLDFQEITNTIDFASDRGSVLLVLAGAGEPTLDAHLMETVAYAYDRSMSVLLFTNGTTMTSDFANSLFDHDVSFVVKKYAMDHQKHDYLLGKPGMSVVIHNGLKTLMNVKKQRIKANKKVSDVAIDCYVSKENITDVEGVLQFCRKNNLIPHIDSFVTFNNGDMKSLSPSQEDLSNLFDKLQEIDSRCYGIDTHLWEGSRVYGESLCLKNKVSFSVRTNGDVYDCVSGKNKFGNIRQNTLENIFSKVDKNIYNSICLCSQGYQPLLNPQQTSIAPCL